VFLVFKKKFKQKEKPAQIGFFFLFIFFSFLFYLDNLFEKTILSTI